MALHRLTAAVLAAIAVWTVSAVSGVGAAGLREYELKAGFLYNVLKFVQWPENPGGPSLPVSVVLIAPAPIKEFAAALGGRSVKGRPIVVDLLSDADAIGDARVVFVTADATGQLPRVLRAVEGRSVLTVAEEGADGSGQAVIALAIAETKLTFDVNLDAAQRARLQLDSNLLALARKVRGGRPRGGA